MKNIYLVMLSVLVACQSPSQKHQQNTLFTRLPASQTGMSFENELALDDDFDVFRYRNYYNGGGVGMGDFNNDGKLDVYLTANMSENKLFLNKGNFEFKDITQSSGAGGTKAWSTGVSIVDINADGLLDIYVCNSGNIDGDDKENELFINNGDLTFTEQAKQYGLDDPGFSTHAVFFDYDLDGDLDCYLLNNSFRPVSSFGLTNIRHIRDELGGDKLYRNDQGKYVDVSEAAGIYGSVIGFGLGVSVSDVNADGWPDIYVSNDFFERDYLYINEGDGSFSERLTQFMGHISAFSMGTDINDINNDGLPEIYVTDMLPEKDYRLKTTTNFETYDVYKAKLENDYYEQYMRNMLHLNNGDGTFSEIGQYAGVAATDWSWGTLIADFDNDGNKEIFVTNGIYKDVTNQDFTDFLASDQQVLQAMRSGKADFQQFVDKMPSTKLSNYMFKKTDDLKYDNVAETWGLDEPSFSNGTAYGDLDNDGDLDLIVNNVNQELFVYRNNTNSKFNHNYLKITLKGGDQNTFGVGAQVKAYVNHKILAAENIWSRGFQSSVEPTITIGLGTHTGIDSLKVIWGPDHAQVIQHPGVNRALQLDIRNASLNDSGVKDAGLQNKIFKPADVKGLTSQVHEENHYVDFDRERLIYHMLSKEGPAFCVADLNNDGLDDIYMGGAKDKAGKVLMQQPSGKFTLNHQTAIEADKSSEDVDAIFFDANDDGLMDLYVVSGGSAYRRHDEALRDRLYLQSRTGGKLEFEKAESSLPDLRAAGSTVKPADFDNDGDLDLFVGVRHIPGAYGIPATSFLLENNGEGKFEDVTMKKANGLGNIGLVTDGSWIDYDGDEDLDLVVVGEWMPVVVFKNNGFNLQRQYNVPGLTKSSGWWNALATIDIDQDGDDDLIAGNWGLNSRFKATKEHPAVLFVHDFDQNKTIDHVYAYYQQDSLYPMALKHELVMQLPSLKKDFLYYKDYAGKTVEQVFGKPALAQAIKHEAFTLASCLIINNGDRSFEMIPLPPEVQFSPVFSILVEDFDDDALPEILLGGNFSGTKPEEGRYDANRGLLLDPLNDYAFKLLSPERSGFFIEGEVRDMHLVRSNDNTRKVVVAKNDDSVKAFEF